MVTDENNGATLDITEWSVSLRGVYCDETDFNRSEMKEFFLPYLAVIFCRYM